MPNEADRKRSLKKFKVFNKKRKINFQTQLANSNSQHMQECSIETQTHRRRLWKCILPVFCCASTLRTSGKEFRSVFQRGEKKLNLHVRERESLTNDGKCQVVGGKLLTFNIFKLSSALGWTQIRLPLLMVASEAGQTRRRLSYWGWKLWWWRNSLVNCLKSLSDETC